MFRPLFFAGRGGHRAVSAGAFLLALLFPDVSPASDTARVSVSATVPSRSTCRFDTRTVAMHFGTIDPAGTADTTATSTIGFRCGGSAPSATFLVTDDGGLHGQGSGLPRMQSTTRPSDYLPYDLTLNPRTGTVPRNTVQALTLTGTVRSVDYRNASPGNYADTVVLTILP